MKMDNVSIKEAKSLRYKSRTKKEWSEYEILTKKDFL